MNGPPLLDIVDVSLSYTTQSAVVAGLQAVTSVDVPRRSRWPGRGVRIWANRRLLGRSWACAAKISRIEFGKIRIAGKRRNPF